MEELKSCRCGNIYLARYDADHNGIKNTYVYCDICGRRESIYTWNNRKDIDAQAAEIERLKAKVAELETDNARMRGLLSELLKNGKEVKSCHPDNSGVAIIETTIDILADIAQLIKGEG